MNANIVIKLNSGESFVYGNVERFRFGPITAIVHQDSGGDLVLNMAEVKEIHIKLMPLMEQICHSVLGLEQQ